MPADSVAQAVVAVVTAPAGTRFELIALGPEAPARLRIEGASP
jgi:hypothetical protein